MRILLTLGLLLALVAPTAAQEKANCYIDYLAMFNQRGTLPVPDGVQNVIVTIRNNADKSCVSMVGTIEVKANQIVGKLMLKTKQGEMVKPKEKLNEKYESTSSPLTANYNIKDAMSSTFLTQNNKVVNLFFIDYLKPKDPAMAEAPKAK